MTLDEITDFKLKLRLYINVLTAIGCFTFVGIQHVADHIEMATIALVGGCYFTTVAYLLRQKRYYLWKGRGHLFIIPPIVLFAIHFNPEFGIYWAYVGVVILFLVLELVDATISVIIFVLLVFIDIGHQFNNLVLYRIYATLTLVGLFSFCLSYLIDRLLVSLNSLATLDPLTKALNRHTFHNAIEIAQEEHQRYQITAILFLFDLDFFKRINDDHGHLAGDLVLQEVAQVVQARLRKTDQFFRYGGEEFAVLLRHTSLQNAAHLAETLRTQIQEHKFCNDIAVTISGGLSEVQSGDGVNEWVDRSDAALYEAKSAGRNCNKINITDLEMLRE